MAKEDVMLIADMIHSCSNDKVAQAALACIGGQFAERIRAAARMNGLNTGRFVAIVVREFARRADQEAHVLLQKNIIGADQPLLHGLRYILEPALEEGALFFDDDPPGFGGRAIGGAACAGLHQFQ
jgi:hypothetical protein